MSLFAGAVASAPAAVSLRDAPTADSCSFTPASGDWNTGGNWTCGHVPTTVDLVTVGSGKTAQVGAAAHTGDLTLSGGTIQFTANVVLDVNLTMGTTGGTLTGTETITVAGHFSKTTASQLAIVNGTELALNDPAPTGTEFSGGQICLNGTGPVLHLSHSFTIATGVETNAFNCDGGHIQIDPGAELIWRLACQ